MSAPAPTPAIPPAARPRRRRWLFVPSILLLLIVFAVGWAYVRGTSGETEVRNPISSSDAPTSQLHRLENGHTTVRAAVLVPHPREKVWAIVADFPHYGDFLPYVKNVTAEPDEDGIKVVKGDAKSAFTGYWAFELHAHEERKNAEAWRVWWQEKGEGEVRINNGGWTLTETAQGETLLVLELEAEVKGTPTWVLRNFFLYRLRQVLVAVKARLDAKKERQ